MVLDQHIRTFIIRALKVENNQYRRSNNIYIFKNDHNNR